MNIFAQNDPVTITQLTRYEYQGSIPYSAYTTMLDKNDRSYVYTASKELGVVIFDISDINNPVIIDTFPVADFNGLKVTNLEQNGNEVYVSLGAFEGSAQNAGLAILDVSDPQNTYITDQWDSSAFKEGAPVVISDGQYAYIGAMEEGLLILNVSNKSNIRFISQIIPDPNFPEPPGFFSKGQARGLAFRNDTIFLCNDSKAFRLIDVSDKKNPVEVGKYINQSLYTAAQPAYNEVAVVDGYAYVTVDYCGLDVIDIRDTSMESVYWYNPWDCNTTNWACSPGHTNQIRVVDDKYLFVSGADTDVLVFNITDRRNPEHIATYGVHGDKSVTWGVDVNDKYIALAHINYNFSCGGIVPYQSDWGGLQILEWNSPTGINPDVQFTSNVYPNPFSTVAVLNIGNTPSGTSLIFIIFPESWFQLPWLMNKKLKSGAIS